MQELQQRAAWDGKIFVDGEFRAPGGGATLTVLDKAAQEPIGDGGRRLAPPTSTRRSRPRRPRSRRGPPSPTTCAPASSAPRPPQLGARADEIATLIVRETGCIRGKAEYEVGGAAERALRGRRPHVARRRGDHPLARRRRA